MALCTYQRNNQREVVGLPFRSLEFSAPQPQRNSNGDDTIAGDAEGDESSGIVV